MAVATLERATRIAFEIVRDPRSDAELLARFCRERDGWSFAELVRRHGPTVFGVCRRVLGDHHAAEDAFQASFLVLARKADSIQPPGTLGAWLYGVAYRTALKARGRTTRRREVEEAYANRPRTEASTEFGEPDLRAAIDEHLNALPSRYRLPLVLCGIQGLGKSEAAAQLGLPEGTVSSRLARARTMLRDRLARQGFIVPAAALAAFLVPRSLGATVPSQLTSATTILGPGFAAGSSAGVAPGVLSLTLEVLRAMTMIKWNLLIVLAITAILAGGFAAIADEKKPAKPGTAADVKKPDGDKPKTAPDGVKPRGKPDGDKPVPDGVKPSGDKPKKPGEGDKSREGERINGKVEKVDASAGTITVVSKSDKGTNQRVVKVASDAKIGVDGKPGKLSDITVGASAFLFVPDDAKEAAAVMITGARLSGNVGKVEGNTVSLETKSEKGATTMSFVVSPDTSIYLEGKPSSVADLKPGMMIGVQLSVDGKTAVALKAGRAGEGDGAKKRVKKPDGDTKPDSDAKPVKKPKSDK